MRRVLRYCDATLIGITQNEVTTPSSDFLRTKTKTVSVLKSQIFSGNQIIGITNI